MLLQTLHIPHIYEDLPSDIPNRDSTCSLLLKVLEDMNRNCLLLDDKDDNIKKSIARAVHSWDQQPQKMAQILLTTLAKNNRFVNISSQSNSTVSPCTRSSCQSAFDIANHHELDVSLVVSGCSQCLALSKAAEISRYSWSSFNAARRAKEDFCLARGAWDKSRFEREIWRPVFQYAKRVRIIDRNIGRFIDGKKKNYKLSKNYERGLQWIVEQFLSHRRKDIPVKFEIHCGVGKGRSASRSDEPLAPFDAACAIVEWAETICKRLNFAMDVIIKREEETDEMFHDRFVITDQIAIQLGRGADLLTSDNKILDVTLTVVKDVGAVDTQLAKLATLLSIVDGKVQLRHNR